MLLDTLPTELVEVIATHLDLLAARSLRLTSSSLKQKSLHVFRDRFFLKRCISWTKHDLDQLVTISTHPTFGPILQHLSIDSTPRSSISLWQLRKRISDSDAIISDSENIIFRSELQEQYIGEEKRAKELATFFNETRHDQKCLQAVFEKLPHMESVVFRFEGMDQKYGKFGRRYCESSQHEMSRPFVSTMAAIAASNIHVKEISIDSHYNHGAVGIGRLESLAPSLGKFATAFARLEKLELNLRDWRYPDIGFELESDRAPFVVRFLMKARSVKHLTISCYSSLEADLIGDMARHCTFDKLETCKLSHFRLHDMMDLGRLLGRSALTLRNLNLTHMALRGADQEWVDLLRGLASDDLSLQALEQMKLDSLYTKRGARIHFKDGTSPRLTVGTEGLRKSWRDELMAQLDDMNESTWGPPWHLAVVAYPFHRASS
ncbi:hypothetical protein DE146DRAFT_259535 [Phaeosphaeria sp. MPI-PUGE-AT-0046c]|nr:hypothetical protein DE146DRAFT_259535 [Phaeosphaeria sp. MPI-PUGE-AT-0046c]